MSIDPNHNVQAQVVVPGAVTMPIREVAELLIKHYGYTEGKYDLVVEFSFTGGGVGPAGALLPGVMLGISRLGLVKTSVDGPLTMDASVINPAKGKRVRKV